MAPLASTRVMHPRWSEHHAPVTEGTMNATCEITHGSTGGGWSSTTGPTPGTPTVTYTGRCRVAYESTQPRDTDAADQAVTIRTVNIALPAGSPAQTPGARVRITAVDTNGPAALVGRVLTLDAVAYPSQAVDQNLTCTDDQANQPQGV